MLENNKSSQAEPKQEHKNHWILWTLVAAFIVISIGIMFGVDYYFAPDVKNLAPNAAEQ